LGLWRLKSSKTRGVYGKIDLGREEDTKKRELHHGFHLVPKIGVLTWGREIWGSKMKNHLDAMAKQALRLRWNWDRGNGNVSGRLHNQKSIGSISTKEWNSDA